MCLRKKTFMKFEVWESNILIWQIITIYIKKYFKKPIFPKINLNITFKKNPMPSQAFLEGKNKRFLKQKGASSQTCLKKGSLYKKSSLAPSLFGERHLSGIGEERTYCQEGAMVPRQCHLPDGQYPQCEVECVPESDAWHLKGPAKRATQPFDE